LGTYDSFDRRRIFESFGVFVALESDDDELLEIAFNIVKKAMLGKISLIENIDFAISHSFGLKLSEGRYELYQNGIRTNSAESEHVLFKYFSSIVRLTIAENAVDRVFVHAGVVAWSGKAVLFPARSFSGKTSIVTELIKLGAEYYSDEYAVIDFEGYVHPFARSLSLRGKQNKFDEIDVPPERFGARIGEIPISVGTVILTEFVEGSSWSPEVLSVGEGILGTIPHTIPLHSSTEMSLNVLNKSLGNAIFLKGPRGEAPDTAIRIIEFLNKNCN
jgi:hypothetical protein